MTMSVASFRKLTPAMVASQRLAMANDIAKTTKSEVAMALKKAAPALGIDGTTYHILDILIGLTLADDWKQSRRPLVAISNEKLAEYVCRSKRTVVRSIRKLVEAGVLAYKDSPTGRRFIYRRGDERTIERGYGFDFSPARQRVQELKKLGHEFAERLKREQDAKRTISRLSRALEDLRLLARQEGVDFQDVTCALSQIDQQGYDAIGKAEALTLLHEQAIELFEGEGKEGNEEYDNDPTLGSNFVQNEQLTTIGDTNVTLYNNTTHQDSSNSNRMRRSSNDDHSNRLSLAKRSPKMAFEKSYLSKSHAEYPTHATDASSPEGFTTALSDVSLGLLKQATLETQSTLDFELTNWAILDESSTDMRLLIGLSEAGWLDACSKLVGIWLVLF